MRSFLQTTIYQMLLRWNWCFSEESETKWYLICPSVLPSHLGKLSLLVVYVEVSEDSWSWYAIYYFLKVCNQQDMSDDFPVTEK